MSLVPKEKLRKRRLLVILLLVALVAFGFRLLIHAESAGSALTYVALPFCVAMVLLFFTTHSDSKKWYLRYWNVLRDSMIVMLSSSIVLFEGFICVLMFIPIYVLVVTITFVCIAISEKLSKNPANRPLVFVLPALILISSMEGTTDELSAQTSNIVEVSRDIDLSVTQIRANLTAPRQLESPSGGFMSLFPPPVLFDAPALNEGDIHTVTYRYHRWLFANTHEGSLTVRLKTVRDLFIETEVLEDTSYIATYLKLHGTRMLFEPIDQDRTRVKLVIGFDRLLHPAWYFQPLERYGVKVMGESILTQLVAGHHGS
ncbi:MAG: hypothetical protein ACR2PS_14295 [Pseudomonadales bacterium]